MADQRPHTTAGYQPQPQYPAPPPPPPPPAYPHGGRSVIETPVETNHTFHLLASIFTLGLWLPVWLLVWAANKGRKRKTVSYTHSY